MEIVAIGNVVVKLVDDTGHTVARTHAMKNGSWAVSYRGYYAEVPEEVAKGIFKSKAATEMLSDLFKQGSNA